MRLSVVKQSFFGPPGQYGRLVTRANGSSYVLSFFFNQLRIVWISDETLFPVFDKASQSLNNSKR